MENKVLPHRASHIMAPTHPQHAHLDTHARARRGERLQMPTRLQSHALRDRKRTTNKHIVFSLFKSFYKRLNKGGPQSDSVQMGRGTTRASSAVAYMRVGESKSCTDMQVPIGRRGFRSAGCRSHLDISGWCNSTHLGHLVGMSTALRVKTARQDETQLSSSPCFCWNIFCKRNCLP